MHTASSQQLVAVLKAKTESKRLQKVGIIFAVRDDPHLRKWRTEQVFRILRESRAVQTYVASDARIGQQFSTLFRKKAFSPVFLNGTRFLQIFLTEKKAVAKTSLP